jgi:hypothetical protein
MMRPRPVFPLARLFPASPPASTAVARRAPGPPRGPHTSTCALLAILLLGAGPACSRAAASAMTALPRGVQETTFETPSGTVTVYLPDDLAAGDILSGTVTAQPGGRTPRAQRRNEAELRGYVVEVGGHRAAVGEGRFTLLLPMAAAAGTAVLLRDAGGRQIASRPIQVAPPGTAGPAAELALPRLGQTGRPIRIGGPFDGDFADSRVEIGGVEAQVLAESPRALVVRSPTGVVGSTEIRVREGETESTGPFRNVSIGLSAPRTSLAAGEREEVTIEASGLARLEGRLGALLRNETPAVIGLESGDLQTIEIDPSQVPPDGRFVATRTITGLRGGAFAMASEIVVDVPFAPPAPGPVAQDPPGTSRPQKGQKPEELVPDRRDRLPREPGGSRPSAGPEEPEATAPSGDAGEPGAAPDEGGEDTEPGLFAGANERIDDAITGIELGDLDGEGVKRAIDEIGALELEAQKEGALAPGVGLEAAAPEWATIGVFLKLTQDSPEDLTQEALLNLLRLVREMNDRLAPIWVARRPRTGAASPAPEPEAPQEPEGWATATYSPASGLLIVVIDGCAPDSEVVVTDPEHGWELARGRTDAAGRLTLRQRDVGAKSAVVLDVKCGDETIRVKVGG